MILYHNISAAAAPCPACLQQNPNLLFLSCHVPDIGQRSTSLAYVSLGLHIQGTPNFQNFDNKVHSASSWIVRFHFAKQNLQCLTEHYTTYQKYVESYTPTQPNIQSSVEAMQTTYQRIIIIMQIT